MYNPRTEDESNECVSKHLELKTKPHFCFLLAWLSSRWTQEQELWELFCSHRCPNTLSSLWTSTITRKSFNTDCLHFQHYIYFSSTSKQTNFFICQLFGYDTPNTFWGHFNTNWLCKAAFNTLESNNVKDGHCVMIILHNKVQLFNTGRCCIRNLMISHIFQFIFYTSTRTCHNNTRA